MKTNVILSLTGAFLFLQILLPAQTLRRVPQDYPKIQQAINAAQTGDTVLVAPGVYYENLQLQGRDIVLSSRYFLDADPAQTIRETVIDGSQPAHPDTASCILIWKGETAATVIQGFTLRGGQGTRWYDHYVPGYFREGGGILVEFSSPVIRHNIIRDNYVPKQGANLISHGGGGIRCGDGSPRIEGNQIVYNRADGYGGGIVFNYCPNAVVENNLIAHNTGGKDYSGGGFWATGAGLSTIIYLNNNSIVFNQSPGPATTYGGKGGGVWIFSITAEFRNNIIWGNTQATGKPVASSDAVLHLKYNQVETGFFGTGNISVAPVFRDTMSFVLEAGSPGIDAGAPDAVFEDYSRNGRRAAFPARAGLRADMGLYGGPHLKNPACPASFLSPTNFTKVLNSPAVLTPGDSRSVNWVDIDNDQDLDLFISNGPQAGENNFLYKNNGNGGFSAVTGDPIVMDGKPSDGATWGDYDNDGDEDCFVVNWYGVNNLLYRNKGDGSFEQILTGNLVTDGGYSETASWGDMDLDGWLDLYVSNSEGNLRNFLYRNQKDGTFQRISSGSPVTDAYVSRSVNWTDMDNDGDADLFVSNENDQNENLYRNDGGGIFTKLSGSPLLTAGGKTMSSSWGDYDNDGDQDVFLANDLGNDGLFRNDGDGNFTKIGTGPVVNSGGNAFGSQWADVDNDGDLDLFVTHAFHVNAWKNFLFINQGNGVFERNETEAPALDSGWSYGCAFGDWDCDGDLDLGVANCFNANQPDYLYENHAAEASNHWLEIKLIGVNSNRSAIGAKVRVESMSNGQLLAQMREISAQSGYCGQNQSAVHFGLGDADSVSVVVVWPGGLQEPLGVLSADRCITVIEGQGVTAAGEPDRGKNTFPISVSPNPAGDSVRVNWEQPVAGGLQLRISDRQGRVVLEKSIAAREGENEWIWDGRDASGAGVSPGLYVLQLTGHGMHAATSVLWVK